VAITIKAKQKYEFYTIGEQQKVITTEAGLEPTRDKPNRFLVDRLNHSATRSDDGKELVFV
jgi:hypothetical protein